MQSLLCTERKSSFQHTTALVVNVMLAVIRCHVNVAFNTRIPPHVTQSVHEKQYVCCALEQRFSSVQDELVFVEHMTGAAVDQSASIGANLQNN